MGSEEEEEESVALASPPGSRAIGELSGLSDAPRIIDGGSKVLSFFRVCENFLDRRLF